MEQSGFFNAERAQDGTYDRTYLAENFAEYFSSFVGNGIFPDRSTACQVMAEDGMRVFVNPGKAWLNGYFYSNTDNLYLDTQPADGVLRRIDRVALRLDFMTREIRAVVKPGDHAATPQPKELQRDADAYEIGIADIVIPAGAVRITQANITDLRLNRNYCGLVTGVIDQVDTTTIFNQYQAWYSEYTKQSEADFDSWMTSSQDDFLAWYNHIKGILNEDVAANLQLQIDTLHTDLKNIKSYEFTKDDYSSADPAEILHAMYHTMMDGTGIVKIRTTVGTYNALVQKYSNRYGSYILWGYALKYPKSEALQDGTWKGAEELGNAAYIMKNFKTERVSYTPQQWESYFTSTGYAGVASAVVALPGGAYGDALVFKGASDGANVKRVMCIALDRTTDRILIGKADQNNANGFQWSDIKTGWNTNPVRIQESPPTDKTALWVW